MTATSPVRIERLAEDALLEAVNIGSGHALTALSRVVGGDRLSLSLPRIVAADRVPSCADLDASGVSVSMTVAGAARFRMLVLFDDASMYTLAWALVGHSRPTRILSAEEESTVVESVNIAGCAFLGALAAMVGGALVPSPPRVARGPLVDLVRRHTEPGSWVLSSGFVGERLSGRIMLVVNHHEAVAIAAALGVTTGA